MLEELAPRTAVMTAAVTVVSLVPEDENSTETAMRTALANRYATVRPFLALLGEPKALDAASAGKRVLAGVRDLAAPARRKAGVKLLLPREVDDKLVPPVWRKAVYANPDLPQGAMDRDAYVVCVLEQLHRALNNRDVFASPSHRWSDPRARLLDGPDWDAVEEDVLAAEPGHPRRGALTELVRGLDAGWKQLAERLEEAGSAAKVSIEVQDDGRAKLNVDKLGALGEPKSLMMFGLFKILGYNFSPRFRDLDDQRFWSATMPGVETGSYGAVEDLARNRVNLNKAITHWADMLRVAGSLVTNQVRACAPLRMFERDGRQPPLAPRSPSTGGSPRPSTCCAWSTRSTTRTAVR